MFSLVCEVKIVSDVTVWVGNAQQAKLCNNYQNIKLKLLKTNAAIWLNRMCKIKHLKPNYIHFKTNMMTPQDRKTTQNQKHFAEVPVVLLWVFLPAQHS